MTANRIALLDEHTANRIAAGEVVERPASVVKELVENSIDAGASSITVTLEEGGKELIKVTDNGCGMTREDAVLSLQRHATSKIRDADDLDAISTLGFRGEALPSIASVSIVEIITSCWNGTTNPTAADYGTRLEIEAGTITNLESVGAPQGTTISVRKLFFNTPARLKFLKTTQTEMSHITDLVGRFAMAYPSIHFRLVHGSREIISSPATGKSLNSITQVMGKDIAKQLSPISFETPAMRVSGFVSNASLTRINRTYQIFFVNGRSVRNKSMTHALDQAYRGLLQPGRYPVAIIFLELTPELVDVNVHPTKSEVKFSSEREVHSAVHRAVNDALMAGAAAPIITDAPTQRSAQPFGFETITHTVRQGTLIGPPPADITAFKEALEKRREVVQNDADPFVWKSGEGVPVEDSPIPEADFDTFRTVALASVKVIGQARNTYIIAQCDDGVLIIDQHVAHERVLFERMLETGEGRRTAMQGLVIPITLSLSAKEAAIVGQRLDQLHQAGFDLEPFGGDTYMVRAVPASIKTSDAEAVLRDMISEIVDLSVTKHLLVKAEQVLITACCKMAVKAGDPLSIQEMNQLIDDLLKCKNPFTCPHGRPIIVSLSNWELDRKFRRV